ncbi:hypothetical protein F4779DRAFT_630191 [Xylariaceae sp. FL0662B]|nr:hypothetical protein F4779DRAFT_630191 [Xylariaceae sp. FL0662B]
MDQHHRDKPIHGESNNLSKPQIFVQLAFGVSWSQRHAPRTHTVTYMSRNLKSARDSGNFPRQLPAPNTNFLTAPDPRQQRSKEHPNRPPHRHQHRPNENSHGKSRPRDHGRPRGQGTDQPREYLSVQPRRGSRSDARAMTHERGRSAPPPFNDSPWDVHQAPASAVSPRRAEATREPPHVWKDLPTPPCQYRLGEDGLPWSAWAWPGGSEGEEELPYENNPTTIPLSVDARRIQDSEQARELESLSTAMMTVDNGFENQWWHQGPREPIGWWPNQEEEEPFGDQEEYTEEDVRPMSMAEAMLLSAAEPPASPVEMNEDQSLNLHALVSPMSSTASASQSYRPLQRSLTTRSEELWLDR